MVAVPTHFFKVVLAERSASDGASITEPEVVLGAFVLPNAPMQPDLPLTAFSVPLESLEEAAGAGMHVSLPPSVPQKGFMIAPCLCRAHRPAILPQLPQCGAARRPGQGSARAPAPGRAAAEAQGCTGPAAALPGAPAAAARGSPAQQLSRCEQHPTAGAERGSLIIRWRIGSPL